MVRNRTDNGERSGEAAGTLVRGNGAGTAMERVTPAPASRPRHRYRALSDAVQLPRALPRTSPQLPQTEDVYGLGVAHLIARKPVQHAPRKPPDRDQCARNSASRLVPTSPQSLGTAGSGHRGSWRNPIGHRGLRLVCAGLATEKTPVFGVVAGKLAAKKRRRMGKLRIGMVGRGWVR